MTRDEAIEKLHAPGTGLSRWHAERAAEVLDAAGAFTHISAADAGEVLRILGSVRGGHAVSSAGLLALARLSEVP